MSRPAMSTEENNEHDIYEIHDTIFPNDEQDNRGDQEAKCKMCGLDDGDGLCEDGMEWATIMGWFVCKECYSHIPRFARMMAEGTYGGRDKFDYHDSTSDNDNTEDRNAEAMRRYEPSLVTGFSQPEWDRPLTDEWKDGYETHLRRIRDALEIMIERRRRLEDHERFILSGIRPLDYEWTNGAYEDGDGEVVPAPPGGLIVMPARKPAQKTDDELVFEMMEIIDKLKETEKMTDNDYLILCNNLKKIREKLMRR